jgi:PAS domain-containing protein
MISARRDLPEKMSNPDMLAWMGRLVDGGSSGKLQLESLSKALPAAIYTTDAEGHITFYNEAAAELWGRRPLP